MKVEGLPPTISHVRAITCNIKLRKRTYTTYTSAASARSPTQSVTPVFGIAQLPGRGDARPKKTGGKGLTSSRMEGRVKVAWGQRLIGGISELFQSMLHTKY
jgi:hypothetical protein